MAKLPALSGRKIINALSKIGYRETRQRGSHIRLACPGKKSVTVPDYRAIDKTLVHKILRDAELTREEFLKLLHE